MDLNCIIYHRFFFARIHPEYTDKRKPYKMCVIINIPSALGIHLLDFFTGWFLVLVKIQTTVYAD